LCSNLARLFLPSGSYVPQFLRILPQEALAESHFHSLEAVDEPQPTTQATSNALERVVPVLELGPSINPKSHAIRRWTILALVTLLVFTGTIVGYQYWKADHPRDLIPTKSTVIDPTSKEGVHVLAGLQSPTLVDSRGQTWTGDRFFTGGDGESIASKTIAFTDDPTIYLRRRRGTFTYNIPSTPEPTS
jgi:hypothetical protein